MTTAIFKKNDLVMNTQGRFTGKRGIVLDVTEDRVIVAGISKFYPKVKTSKSKFARFFKKKQTEVFIKKMNPMHLHHADLSADLNIKTKINFENKDAKNKAKVELTKIFNENANNINAKWIFEPFQSA